MIEEEIKSTVRNILDFPKPGVHFRDITPILKDPDLCSRIIEEFARRLEGVEFDAIASIESRGFLFGFLLANKLNKPFLPIRKTGKLPAETISESYELEYGTTTIEMHADAILPGQKILIHDDLLATGGTVMAASNLIEKVGGKIAAYTFVIGLDYLEGENRLKQKNNNVITLANYM